MITPHLLSEMQNVSLQEITVADAIMLFYLMWIKINDGKNINEKYWPKDHRAQNLNYWGWGGKAGPSCPREFTPMSIIRMCMLHTSSSDRSTEKSTILFMPRTLCYSSE